jgi:bidirectional [NiFe] hydrogenase diaphorase subunit
VRCLGFCYAAPALLDGTEPHAGPELATMLTRGTADAPLPIPVAAITKPVVLAEILEGNDPWQHMAEVVASWGSGRLITELEASGLRGRGRLSGRGKWSAAATELTSGWTDGVTSCREYKVTAVSVQPA